MFLEQKTNHLKNNKKLDFGAQEPPKWLQNGHQMVSGIILFLNGRNLDFVRPYTVLAWFLTFRGPGIHWKPQGNRTWKKHTKKHDKLKACSKKHKRGGEEMGAKLLREFTFFWPGCFLAPFWSLGRFKTSFGCQNDEKMDPQGPQGPQNNRTNAEKWDGILTSWFFAERVWILSALVVSSRAAGFREAYWIYIYIYIYIWVLLYPPPLLFAALYPDAAHIIGLSYQ